MSLPISIIILTYNEEENINDCLKSVYDLTDDIFIVDSYSTDNTLEIAKKYTDKIYQRHFENYAQQRNWAQQNLPIKNEWIFHLDADERVSQRLASEIKKTFSSTINIDGLIMSRKTIFKGKWIRFGGHYPAYHLRIFRKSKGSCEEKLYDQHFLIDGKIAKLKWNIINIITPDFKNWVSRHRKWAFLESQEIFLNKKKLIIRGTPIERKKWLKYNIYYKLPLFIRPFIYFIYRYIFMFGFLDGRNGLLFHFWQGFWYRLLVDIEIYELRRKNVYSGH